MPSTDSPYLAFGSILAFIAAAMFVAAVASPDWYEMHSGSAHFRVGYFEICNTSGGPVPKEMCTSFPFDVDFCGHNAADMKLRQGFGSALGLLGCALNLVIVLLLLLAWCLRKHGCFLYTTLVLAGVSIAGFLISIILIANTYESWYYCGTDFCDYASTHLNAIDCVTFHGYSFVYAVIALFAAVMCFAVILALLVQECYEREEKKAGKLKKKSKKKRHERESNDDDYDDGDEEEMLAIADRPHYRGVIVSSNSPFHDNRIRHRLEDANDPYGVNRTTHDVARERSTTPGRSNRVSPSRGASQLSNKRASPPRASPSRNPIEEIARSPSTPRRRYDDEEVSGLNNLSEIPSRGGRGGPQGGVVDDDEGRAGYWPSDWVFHPESKLYWSTSQQLYLDPATEHYYDPHSGKWYDPKRDVWYDKD